MPSARVSAFLIVLAAAATAIACSGGGGDGDGGALVGVWRGEQAASNPEGRAGPLCLLVAHPDSRVTPAQTGTATEEHFSGGLYVGSDFLGLIAGTLDPNGAVTFRTMELTYTGTLEGDAGSGVWSASGPETAPPAGSWTLARTDDEACQ
jgi:hypothetical protein